MSAVFALDASVVVPWFVTTEASAAAAVYRKALADGAEWVAPDLLLAEVANALWKLVRFGDLPEDAVHHAVRNLIALPKRIVGTETILARALEIAIAHRITVYDAVYVSLCDQRRVPLITADRKMWAKVRTTFPLVRLLSGSN